MDNALSAAANLDLPNWFVVCMGIGTVFVGLICIIFLCKIVSLFCRSGRSEKGTTETVPAVKAKDNEIQNRQEILAAVTAVIAEELGTDVSAIRVHSFKKI